MLTKEEIVGNFKSGMDQAADTLFVAAKDLGKVEGIDEGKLLGRKELQAEIDALPKPVEDENGEIVQGFTQEQLDQAKADAKAEGKAESDQEHATALQEANGKAVALQGTIDQMVAEELLEDAADNERLVAAAQKAKELADSLAAPRP